MGRRLKHGSLLGMIACVSLGCSDDSSASPGSDTESSETSGSQETSGSDSAGTSGADGSTTADPTLPNDTSDTNDTAELDEVEDACEADCDAQFATECPPAQSNSLLCKYQCALATVSYGGFCLDPYTAWVSCRAEGGYDCLNGYPTPRATCAVEQAAYSECTLNAGCKQWCAAGIDEGCLAGPFDECLADCDAGAAALPEQCGYQDNSYRSCLAQTASVCTLPAGFEESPCTSQLTNIGDCIADQTEDLCEGYCYVADETMCGSNCMADCQAQLDDPTCGQSFADLVDRCFLIGEFVCVDGGLVGTGSCESDQMQYDACLAG